MGNLNFEDELRSRFSTERLDTDLEGQNALWSGIENGLDAKKKDKRRIFFFFLFSLMGIGAVTLFVSSMNWDSDIAEVNNARKSSYPEIRNENQLEKKSIDINETLSVQAGQDAKLLGTLPKYKQPRDMYFSNTANEVQERRESLNKSMVQRAFFDASNNSLLDQLPIRPLQELEYDIRESAMLERLPNPSVSLEHVSDKPNNRFSIGVGYNLNYPLFDIKSSSNSSEAQLLDQYESKILGFGLSVLGELRFKNDYLLKSGISYQEVWKKFEFTKVENIQVNRQDQIIRIHLDDLTGDTLFIQRGDVMVDATIEKKRVQYSNFRLLRIPVEFGWTKKLDRWEYGISGGATAMFLLSSKQEALDLDNTILTNYEHFSGIGLGLSLSTPVYYALGNNFNVYLSPSVYWQLNSEASSDIYRNTKLLMFETGLMYSF